MIDLPFIRTFCLAMEATAELPHFEKTSFRVKGKIFLTVDTYTNLACVKLTEMDQSLFSAFDKSVVYPVPNKWGKQGYTFVNLQRIQQETFEDLVKTSYALVSAKKPTKKSPSE